MEQIDSNTKILFLCSPNNPTGNSFRRSIVEELLQNFEGLVIIDEAYIDFSNEQSWLSKIRDISEFNYCTNSIKSLCFGRNSYRICYASKEIINSFKLIKPPYNVNELSQQKAIARLQKMDEIKMKLHS